MWQMLRMNEDIVQWKWSYCTDERQFRHMCVIQHFHLNYYNFLFLNTFRQTKTKNTFTHHEVSISSPNFNENTQSSFSIFVQTLYLSVFLDRSLALISYGLSDKRQRCRSSFRLRQLCLLGCNHVEMDVGVWSKWMPRWQSAMYNQTNGKCRRITITSKKIS
jgi:hypothetical protein